MRLGKLIAMYRFKNDIGVREMAQEIGISHSTISRLENGYDCDSKTLMKVLNWLTEEVA